MYLPEAVKYIINKLESNGYEAYAVGGCVRDSILNRNPDDWDITTSAKPEVTKMLFEKTFDTGIEHGTITVLIDNVGYEVTTYRIDGEYLDSRHPNDVEFTTSLKDDLLRRDFTINAMAYSHQKGLVDEFQGVEDLGDKIIRCVGNPYDRFSEDALRILRAIRFSAQLGFEIEEKTAEAIKALAPTLSCISAERIQVEIIKLLVSDNPDYINMAYELGVTAVILPEWDKMMETQQETSTHRYSVGEHTLKMMNFVGNNKVSRLTVLLHDVAKPLVSTIDNGGVVAFKGHQEVGNKVSRGILKRIKLDNKTIDMVCKLISVQDLRVESTESSVRKSINKIGIELYPFYLEMRYADIMAQSEYVRKMQLLEWEETKKLHEKIINEGQCVSLKQLKLGGQELLQLGVTQGKQIGEILNALLDIVLEDNTLNTVEYLKIKVKEMM